MFEEGKGNERDGTGPTGIPPGDFPMPSVIREEGETGKADTSVLGRERTVRAAFPGEGNRLSGGDSADNPV